MSHFRSLSFQCVWDQSCARQALPPASARLLSWVCRGVIKCMRHGSGAVSVK